MKLTFFNFKFCTKWIDYWLKELEERGNAQKRTLTILLYIYSVSITIEKSSRHWPMCEYCSHEAAAAYGRRSSCNKPCDIWVYERHIHKGRRAYQENDKRRSRSHNIVKYRMTQGDVLHCFVVIKYAPRVILKPFPIARLWETQKFLDLVREFIKMSGLFCLFLFSERS